ncbi:MAG: sugar phosphate nucleotidyltransferase [Vicinamibacterales bacterium]
MRAVILAGGKGVRLMPFTTRLPKPLMPIGDRTIIEHLLGQLRDCGVTSVTVCTAHHAKLIEDVVGDGRRFGLDVVFRRDKRPGLSTLAPVRELVGELPSHFLMLNADILCDVEFGTLYRQGVESGAPVTVAIHEEVVPGAHPRCEVAVDNRITQYDPRPAIRHWVNMGIYVLARSALDRVPADQPYGMDSLMRDLLAEGRTIGVYRSTDTWLDVGVPEELARAQELFLRTGSISSRARGITPPHVSARVPAPSGGEPLPGAAPQAPSSGIEETGVFSISSVAWGAIYTRAPRGAVPQPAPAPREPDFASSGGVHLVRFPPGAAVRDRLPIVMTCGAGPTPLIGSERFALHLARELAAQGDQVSLVIQTPGQLDPDDLGDAIVTSLPALDLRTFVDRLDTPAAVLAVDLVWPGASRVAVDAARAWRVPAVIVPASAQEAWLDPALSLDLCTRADAVFCVTAAEGRALVRKGVAAGTIRVIGYGAYAESAPPEHLPPALASGEYVLFLGRKRRDKGYRELLAAAPLVWQRFPDVSFVFIGPRIDPDCLDWFEQTADQRIVEAHGLSIAAKDAAVEGCALMCLPTTSDIFPQAFLEAWRAGKPVISGPFDGAHEVVRHGIDGLVVDARAEAIAAAIESLLAAPGVRSAMGRAGEERVRGELSWASMTSRVGTLLRELASVGRI